MARVSLVRRLASQFSATGLALAICHVVSAAQPAPPAAAAAADAEADALFLVGQQLYQYFAPAHV